MFDRRVEQSARELERRHRRPTERETAAGGHRVRVWQTGDELCLGAREDHRRESVTSCFGPVAERVWCRESVLHLADRRSARLGLGDEEGQRSPAEAARRAIEGMGTQAFRPAMEGRVRRGRVAV